MPKVYIPKLILPVNRFSQCAWILVLLAMSTSHAFAQEMELVTDRPDQTESSVVVPPGYVQIEAGWTFTSNDDNGTDTESYEIPGTLLRIGILDRVELRLGWSGYVSEETKEGGVKTETDGSGDAEIGTKIYLWEENDWIPEAALLAAISLPIGETGLSSERADPTFRFSFAHELSDRLAFAYNLGMTWESDLDQGGERDTLSFFNYTTTLGIGLSDQWGAYIELFGDIPLNANGNPKNSFNGGFTFLVLDNLQLDAFVGFGLSEDADDLFAGLGVSYRFPN